MPYPALAIANYFIYRAGAEGVAVDPLKLQKLLYFANGWHLALYREPLIREPIRAWNFGPVIPAVYHAFRSHGRHPISEPVDPEEYEVPREDERTRALLDKVWKEYGHYAGVQLSTLSHDPDGPWFKQMHKSAGLETSPKLSDEEIRQYFLQLAEATA
jgi:uncharacterized phage-associated protein